MYSLIWGPIHISLFRPGERVEKQKRATTESDNTEDWHSEYQIYDVATNSKVSWTSIHIHRLKTFIINNRDGEKLSEFLTGLQAAIQVILFVRKGNENTKT